MTMGHRLNCHLYYNKWDPALKDGLMDELDLLIILQFFIVSSIVDYDRKGCLVFITSLLWYFLCFPENKCLTLRMSNRLLMAGGDRIYIGI